MTSRKTTLVLGLFGAVALVGAGIMTIMRDITPGVLILVGLALPVAWLRINLEPAGYITLAPVVVATSLALAPPHVPVLVSSLSAVTSGGLFAHQRVSDILADVGGEVVPVILALIASGLIVSPQEVFGNSAWTLRFAAAIGAYVLGRIALAAMRAKVSEGISASAFLGGPGKSVAANMLFLSFLGLGLSYLTYRFGNTGYFALTLAVVALMESYYPYKLLSDQRDTLFASLGMIAQAIDLKDAYTGRHGRDASEIAVRIARALHLPEPEVRKIRIAAILHDIGKVGISGKIIRKPSTLDPDEMSTMRQHPVIGAEIMQPVELLAEAADIVRHHHEHFDGTGYPDGLKGAEIPTGSRIVLVADAFNAITTERPYRKARSKEEALQILRAGSGRQFDPAVVQVFEYIATLL